MGTSASYSAPPSWGDLKSTVTRQANGERIAPRRLRNLVKEFVEHNGGATGIARRGGGGSGVAKGTNAKAIAGRLGGFLANVGRLGLDGALEAAGWGDLVGLPVKEVCRALLDRLGGESSTIDDVDARAALAALEKEYFDKAKSLDELEKLMRAQVMNIEQFLQEYFSLYLYEVFCRVFFERLLQRVGETNAYGMLGQIKKFINEKLADLTANRNLKDVNWKGRDGQRLTTEVMESTLRVFE